MKKLIDHDLIDLTMIPPPMTPDESARMSERADVSASRCRSKVADILDSRRKSVQDRWTDPRIMSRKWSSGGPEDYRTAGRRSAVRPRPLAEEAATSADSQLIPAASSRQVRTM